ncbi:MAG: glycosyltransferase family 1 protein [Patescibacteria group bacterium]
MIIGIHSIAAFKKQKTGVEEYAFQLIKHLAMLPEAREHHFLLYTDKGGDLGFDLPENFEIRILKWSAFAWTQARLSLEMLKKECDVLFIPAHVLPIVHSRNSVVAIHGLEYEYFPEHYPFWFSKYLRWSTKYAARNARKITTVSNNTKKDLVELYGVSEKKIKVIHHGVEKSEIPPAKIFAKNLGGQEFKNYILYIGRIELKKNIVGIIKAFEIFKEKYKLPHKLILAGSPGFGYEKIKYQILHTKYKNTIIETGYVDNEEKERLYNNASLFLFPSFYEGFGMPILEAQARGVPVISSNISSMPEVGGRGALYVDPNGYNDIADKMYALLTDENLRNDMINKGYENIKKFSWEKCARETLNVLLDRVLE